MHSYTAALLVADRPAYRDRTAARDREIIEAETDGAVLRRIGGEDQIVRIRAKTRHTTVIALPQTENILDFVVGDSEYWHLTGAANLAFLKPIAEGVTTNVALVCESGRIYSFLVTEQSAGTAASCRPHQATGRGRSANLTRQTPTGFCLSRAGGRLSADGGNRYARRPRPRRWTRIAASWTPQAVAAGESQAFRAEYPTRLKFPYQLEDKARKWPFMVEGMWHDGQFTYLRSNAQESPALYEEKDGKPALVAYDLQPDGLYIARHVLGNGWLQIGKQKAKWRFTAPEIGP